MPGPGIGRRGVEPRRTRPTDGTDVRRRGRRSRRARRDRGRGGAFAPGSRPGLRDQDFDPAEDLLPFLNGERIADLMIEHDRAVVSTKVHELKEVSNEFLDEYEV